MRCIHNLRMNISEDTACALISCSIRMKANHSWLTSSHNAIKNYYKIVEILENVSLLLCMCKLQSKKLQTLSESPSSRFCPTSLTTHTFIFPIFHYWASIWDFNQYFLFLQWVLCLITISLDPEASPLLRWSLVLFQVLHIRSDSTSYSK